MTLTIYKVLVLVVTSSDANLKLSCCCPPHLMLQTCKPEQKCSVKLINLQLNCLYSFLIITWGRRFASRPMNNVLGLLGYRLPIWPNQSSAILANEIEWQDLNYNFHGYFWLSASHILPNKVAFKLVANAFNQSLSDPHMIEVNSCQTRW